LNLINQLPEFVNDAVAIVRQWVEQPEVNLGPLTFSLGTLDWISIREQLLGFLEPLLTRSGQYVGQIASSTVRFLGNVLFLWIISIYLSLEIPRLGGYVGRAAQLPGYRKDAERLMADFGDIWSAYLRGQIILGLIIGIIVGLSLALLGVQNALALGLLSGLLEFIPVLGPFIGTGAALIVGFFQPGNYLGLTSLQFALIILAIMFVIQQVENNVLVPRIVGNALDLHPLLVILGVLMGSSIAGILGAILAAPVLASIKLLGLYAWRKLFDLPPFPLEEADVADQPKDSILLRLRRARRALNSARESSDSVASGDQESR
jgi:predicted PurR-regulated permease PerM